MYFRIACGFMALSVTTGCQTIRSPRSDLAATIAPPADKYAQPVLFQKSTNADAAGDNATSDGYALETAPALINQASASAASGSPQAYTASEAESRSYQDSGDLRDLQSSECSSGCCSNE